MTKTIKKFTPKERVQLLEVFEDVSRELTPDFSAEDWLTLLERANSKDMTSMEMLHALFNKHLRTYMKGFEWWDEIELRKKIREKNLMSKGEN